MEAEGLDLSHIFFSNEEYCRKLEELKKAHLQTMADLELMYQQKLLLSSTRGPDAAALLEAGDRCSFFFFLLFFAAPQMCLVSSGWTSVVKCVRLTAVICSAANLRLL